MCPAIAPDASNYFPSAIPMEEAGKDKSPLPLCGGPPAYFAEPALVAGVAG